MLDVRAGCTVHIHCIIHDIHIHFVCARSITVNGAWCMVHGACVKVMVMIKVKCKMVLPGVGNRYQFFSTTVRCARFPKCILK